jgi:hypothetical protein
MHLPGAPSQPYPRESTRTPGHQSLAATQRPCGTCDWSKERLQACTHEARLMSESIRGATSQLGSAGPRLASARRTRSTRTLQHACTCRVKLDSSPSPCQREAHARARGLVEGAQQLQQARHVAERHAHGKLLIRQKVLRHVRAPRVCMRVCVSCGCVCAWACGCTPVPARTRVACH